MNWEVIQNVFRSPETLTFFSFAGLPTKARAESKARQTSLLALPFGRNVVVTKAPEPGLLDYYASLGLAPEILRTLDMGSAESTDEAIYRRQNKLGHFPKLASLCPSEASRKIATTWKSQHPFSEASPETFHKVLGRDFLLLHEERSGRDGVSTLPAVSVAKAKASRVAKIWDELNLWGDGLLLRKYYSVFGDGMQRVANVEEWESLLTTSPLEGALLVPQVPASAVHYDLELAFSTDGNKAELLGVVRQLGERRRHIGSTSVELPEKIQAELEVTVNALARRLNRIGFTRGIFGLDGFVVSTGGTAKFLAYDLNPCLSQAFFPLYQKRQLENQFGAAQHFAFHLYSILPEIAFSEFAERVELVTHSPRGVFPLLFDSTRGEAAFGRTSVMALFLADSTDELERRIQEFEAKLGRKRKIYKMAF